MQRFFVKLSKNDASIVNPYEVCVSYGVSIRKTKECNVQFRLRKGCSKQ